MSIPDSELPGISIILAVRNEAEQLARTLDAIINLDYPHDRTEIILVDGMSTDETPTIIHSLSKSDARIRCLQNPGVLVSSGMNLGVSQARFELILWTSGHTLLKPDHLRKCVAVMRETNAAAVGGVLETAAYSSVGKINATILSSPFGVGNARHRIGGESGWVPAVTMALYRKDAILAAGGFDESLPRNQDNDLHERMNQQGLRSYMDASIQPVYLCRETFTGLLKQAWTNGFWNVMLTKMGRRGLNLRHFTPLLFVLLLVSLAVISLFIPPALIALIAVAGLYLLTDVIASVVAGLRRRMYWQILPMIFWFPSLHFCYGLGSWAAMFTPLRRNNRNHGDAES